MTQTQNGVTQNVFGKVFLTVSLRTANSVAKECLSNARSAVLAGVSQFIIRITLDNDQLDAQILTHLLQSSTFACFEQYLAHPREVRLY